jgi:hypothetical protein
MAEDQTMSNPDITESAASEPEESPYVTLYPEYGGGGSKYNPDDDTIGFSLDRGWAVATNIDFRNSQAFREAWFGLPYLKTASLGSLQEAQSQLSGLEAEMVGEKGSEYGQRALENFVRVCREVEPSAKIRMAFKDSAVLGRPHIHIHHPDARPDLSVCSEQPPQSYTSQVTGAERHTRKPPSTQTQSRALGFSSRSVPLATSPQTSTAGGKRASPFENPDVDEWDQQPTKRHHRHGSHTLRAGTTEQDTEMGGM